MDMEAKIMQEVIKVLNHVNGKENNIKLSYNLLDWGFDSAALNIFVTNRLGVQKEL